MSLDANRLSHAYITDAVNTDTLLMAVVCGTRDGKRPCGTCSHCDKASRRIHPDIITVERLDNKLIIGVDQIRELRQDVHVVPNDAMQKAYVVRDADAMNINAQNAFLRILEEPPAHAVFILCTDNPAALLPTVRSRCVELKSHFAGEQAGEHTGDETDYEQIGELVGKYIKALKGDREKLMECMFSIDKLDKHAFYDFLTIAREKLVSILREDSASDSGDIRKALVRAESILIKAGEMLDLNVSAGHIAGFICASMIT